MSWFGIFIFVVAIVVAILIHEAAHMFTARRFGMKIEEYFVGFGPRLWSTRRGETEYGVKAFVFFGGYVKIAGMNPLVEVTPEEYPRTFGAKPIWQRALVIFAGPATHFVIAFVLFALWAGIAGTPSAHNLTVGTVEAHLRSPSQNPSASPGPVESQLSPAKAAGLRTDDLIVGIGNVNAPTFDQFSAYIKSHADQPIELRILRAGQPMTLQVTPRQANINTENRPAIGVGTTPALVRHGVIGSIEQGVMLTGSTVAQVLGGLGHVFDIPRLTSLIFGNAQRSVQDPVSMVGAARLAGEEAQTGTGNLLYLFAVLNVVLGIFNLLPLLPFDGGHLAVLGVEKLRGGKKIDPRKLIPISATVLVLLVTFGMALFYLDIVKPLSLNHIAP